MSDTSTPARPIFDPVDTSFDPTDVTARDDVESPSLSSSNALARFEFEPEKKTKVLMVEWEEDASTKTVQGDWEISWEGKKTVLPAREQQANDGGDAPVNRLYFLLGNGVSIPSTVRLQKGNVVWRTNPLPAIFSPELGATATQAGKRGVLHTIWSKKRLQVLQKEIENETKDNLEGIGLEMAVAEKQWIEQNFGVTARPGSTFAPGPSTTTSMNSPSSPRSPGGGRLMDKLKGLKVGTSTQELHSTRRDATDDTQQPTNPLSPETSDVAVGSFGSFAAIKGAANPSPPARQLPPRKMAAQKPPERHAAMGSLNAFASGDTTAGTTNETSDHTPDDLFALPMSPKSAATAKSPFSFAAQDTMRYVKGEKAA